MYIQYTYGSIILTVPMHIVIYKHKRFRQVKNYQPPPIREHIDMARMPTLLDDGASAGTSGFTTITNSAM